MVQGFSLLVPASPRGTPLNRAHSYWISSLSGKGSPCFVGDWTISWGTLGSRVSAGHGHVVAKVTALERDFPETNGCLQPKPRLHTFPVFGNSVFEFEIFVALGPMSAERDVWEGFSEGKVHILVVERMPGMQKIIPTGNLQHLSVVLRSILDWGDPEKLQLVSTA